MAGHAWDDLDEHAAGATFGGVTSDSGDELGDVDIRERSINPHAVGPTGGTANRGAMPPPMMMGGMASGGAAPAAGSSMMGGQAAQLAQGAGAGAANSVTAGIANATRLGGGRMAASAATVPGTTSGTGAAPSVSGGAAHGGVAGPTAAHATAGHHPVGGTPITGVAAAGASDPVQGTTDNASAWLSSTGESAGAAHPDPAEAWSTVGMPGARVPGSGVAPGSGSLSFSVEPEPLRRTSTGWQSLAERMSSARDGMEPPVDLGFAGAAQSDTDALCIETREWAAQARAEFESIGGRLDGTVSAYEDSEWANVALAERVGSWEEA